MAEHSHFVKRHFLSSFFFFDDLEENIMESWTPFVLCYISYVF